MLWALPLERSLLLQLLFNIIFIPSAPLFWPPATQQISEKHLCFSQLTSRSEEQMFHVQKNKLACWDRVSHCEASARNHCERYPGNGLKSRPWEVGVRLSVCSGDHHDSITNSRSSVAAAVGDTASYPSVSVEWAGSQMPWLCPRKIAARYLQWRTKLLGVLSLPLKMERDAWQNPASSAGLALALELVILSHIIGLWCHPMPSALGTERKPA